MAYSEPGKITASLVYFSQRFWLILYFLVVVFIGVFAFSLVTAPDTIQVQYTPDDGYYYLTLAKNFIRLGYWTFDSQNVTSGFHVLWAYLLAAIYWIGKPTDNQFVLWGLILSSIITLATVFLIGWESTRDKGGFWNLIVGVLLISSHNFIYNSVSITEWSLVILCAYLCLTRWYQNDRGSWIILFGSALAGTLSRTDFILLPFILFTISLVIFCFERESAGLFRAALGFGGSVLGLLLVGINNFVFTGSLFQSSALIKAYWAKVYGINYLYSMFLTSDLLGFDRLTLELQLAVFFFVSITMLYFLVKAIYLWDKKRLSELAPIMGAGTTFLGYTWLYAYNGAIQPWYTGNLLMPIWMLGTVAVKFLWNHNNNQFRIVISLLVFMAVLHNIFKVVPVEIKNPPWPHQQIMLEAGKYLKQTKLDGAIASWNAGIIGYYQGGTVINIDGLVNNEVYDYVVNNSLYRYLLQEKVKYIIDFDNMIDVDYLRLRGGYDDARFLESLQPLKVFDDGRYFWKHLTLYQIYP